MTMFMQSKEFARMDLCREFGEEGWLEVPLCHLATEALRKYGFSKTKYREPLAFFDSKVSQIEK